VVKPDYLIVAAPTGNAISTAERSVLWIKLESFGKSAHAGSTWLGDNAVERMVRLIARLQGDLMPQIALRQGDNVRSTLNIGQFHGGTNTNMVPDFCQVQIDRRLLHSEDPEKALAEIVACLEAAGEPEGSWSVQMVRCTNAYRSPRDGVLVTALADAVTSVTGKPALFSPAVGVSDGHYFAKDGIEIVNIGPGAGGGHDSNETVPIDQMIEAAMIQLHLIDKLLGART
jgi:acetylornithine deacetylase/succinyl-diaminopimelate desuccinylase-like protein